MLLSLAALFAFLLHAVLGAPQTSGSGSSEPTAPDLFCARAGEQCSLFSVSDDDVTTIPECCKTDSAGGAALTCANVQPTTTQVPNFLVPAEVPLGVRRTFVLVFCPC